VSRRAIRIVGIACLVLVALGVAGGGGGGVGRFAALEQQPHQSINTATTAHDADVPHESANATAAAAGGIAAFWARIGRLFSSSVVGGLGEKGRRQQQMSLILAEERGRQIALVERAMRGDGGMNGDGRTSFSPLVPPPSTITTATTMASSIPSAGSDTAEGDSGGGVVGLRTAPSSSTSLSAAEEAPLVGAGGSANQHHLPDSLLRWLCAPSGNRSPYDTTSDKRVEEEAAKQKKNNKRRVAYGTLAPLPPTVSVKGYVAKVGRTTLCNSSTDPLRVTILLAGEKGASSSPSSPLMATQLKALTGPRNTTESDDFLNAALVTVIVSSKQQQQQQRSLIVAVVHYVSNVSGAVLLEPTVISIPSSSSTDSTALSVIGSQIAAAIESGSAAANSRRVVALLQRPAHFVYRMPSPSAVMSTANIAALCIQDPMLNEESEAKAYYPYAHHQQHNRHGSRNYDAGWRDETEADEQDEENEGRTASPPQRWPLAFVHVPAPRDGEEVEGAKDDHDADGGYPLLIHLVTSCRAPIPILRPKINSQHYTKGGDIVLRGLGRYAGIRVPSSGPSSPSLPSADGTNATVANASSDVKVYVNFLMGVNVETILTTRTPTTTTTTVGGGGGKRSRVLPNYTIPLPSPLSFNTTDPIATLAVHPEAIFRMRRPLGHRCSDSPLDDPTRVASMIPFYLDASMDWKKSRSVFVRACQAAAAMTRHSDLVVVTNVPTIEFRQVMRRAVRQMMAGQPQQQGGGGKMPPPPPLPAPDPAVFMDTHYPSALGEFVLVHLDLEKAQIPRILNGMVEHRIMAAKGFYDVVRYS